MEGEGRAPSPKKAENGGRQPADHSTICESRSYKPLAFQRFRLKKSVPDVRAILGMIAKSGVSFAESWSTETAGIRRLADCALVSPKHDRPARGGAMNRTR